MNAFAGEPMIPSMPIISRVLDEEIERLGKWWDAANAWVVWEGETHEGYVDLISDAYSSASSRTGVSAQRIRELIQPMHTLTGRGHTLKTRRAHRERRITDGTLRQIDHTPGDGSNPFLVYEPVTP